MTYMNLSISTYTNINNFCSRRALKRKALHRKALKTKPYCSKFQFKGKQQTYLTLWLSNKER